jgi:membrane protease YdiL (CAAX protease family)
LSERQKCPRCGAALGPVAKFCGVCGATTRAHRANVRARMGEARSLDRRHVLAVGVVFVGTLVALIAVALALGDDASDASVAAWSFAAQICAGLGALALLGRGSLADSFAGRPPVRALLLAAPIGALAFAIALGWVDFVLVRAFEGSVDESDVSVASELSVPLALAVIVGAPLVEEWLDRGVLWRALEPLTTPPGQIVVTAALFALAHGLGGGFVLELPHRFIGGLALGALRARSGSLVPPIVAHMTWNALAVWSGS